MIHSWSFHVRQEHTWAELDDDPAMAACRGLLAGMPVEESEAVPSFY